MLRWAETATVLKPDAVRDDADLELGHRERERVIAFAPGSDKQLGVDLLLWLYDLRILRAPTEE